MRKLGLSLLLCGFAFAPQAALSQDGASSADEYVCALTGECGDEAEAPATADQPAGSPRVSATRGFSLARPNAPAARTPAPRNRRVAARPAPRAPRVATGQPGRVNVRVAFAPGSATLNAAAQAEVRAFAQALQRPQLAEMRFRIEGHTDSSGGRAINMTLSEQRARAVADYLVAQGVARSRLEVEGYGYDRPLPGRSAAAAANRRVEAVRIS